MRRLYTFFLYFLTPFILFRLFWKGRKLTAYRERIAERFMLAGRAMKPVDIWVHAVSLGEVVAVTPLLDALLANQHTLLITTMTPTGSQQVMKRFGDKVQHQYIPYDLPVVLRRFFKGYQPKLGIIMETELWPNLIAEAKKNHIPLLLANARLSDRAFKQYIRFRFFFKSVLKQFDTILAQSAADASRFTALGAPAESVQAFGNMKFDLQIPTVVKPASEVLKARWGSNRPVIIAASTHNNEEEQILDHLKTLQAAIPGLLLLIAPRHPERFQTVYQLALAKQYQVGRRSEETSITLSTEVVIVDTLGELLSFYQVSDYAFVGGSLVPIGGHNVLEPIALRVPVFCGPFMQNSKAICDDLNQAGAIQIVQGIEELIKALVGMHNNPQQKAKQVSSASETLNANQGTTQRYIEIINSLAN